MQETGVQSLSREDSPGEGNGNPLQNSCLENPMDGGAWQATVHGVAKSQRGLSNFTFRGFELQEYRPILGLVILKAIKQPGKEGCFFSINRNLNASEF